MRDLYEYEKDAEGGDGGGASESGGDEGSGGPPGDEGEARPVTPTEPDPSVPTPAVDPDPSVSGEPGEQLGPQVQVVEDETPGDPDHPRGGWRHEGYYHEGGGDQPEGAQGGDEKQTTREEAAQ